MIVIIIRIIAFNKLNFISPHIQRSLSLWDDLNVTYRSYDISQVEPMVWAVAIYSLVLWVFYASWILSNNEMSDTTI